MSMSRRALKLVQKSLPRLCLCNDMLVLPPTKHILRGFTFERTTSKGMFYLWRIVMPLYRPTTREVLEYSERIPKGEYVQLSKEAPVESAAVVAKIISDDLPNLEKICSPEDFFFHISWMLRSEMQNVMLDVGLTYYMIGRLEDALKTFEKFVLKLEDTLAWLRKEPGRPGSMGDRVLLVTTERRRIAKDIVALLKSNPAAVAERIEAWERENIERFNLAQSMPKAVAV